MWCDHPFSQRNKITERAVGVWAGGDMERWRVGENEKKEGLGNIGGSS